MKHTHPGGLHEEQAAVYSGRSGGFLLDDKPDNIGDFLNDLWRRRGLLAASLAIGALMGILVWLVSPWQFVANATLLVQPADTTAPIREETPNSPVTAEAIRTEVGLFQAPDNLLATVDDLRLEDTPTYTQAGKPGLASRLVEGVSRFFGRSEHLASTQSPGDDALDTVKESLDVFSSGQDHLILLRYRDTNRKRSERVLGALISNYFAARAAQSEMLADESLSVLGVQAKRLRVQSEAAEREALSFRRKHELLEMRLGTTEEQEIAALTTPLAEVRAEHARISAALDNANPESYGQLREVLESTTVVALRAREAELMADEASVSIKALDNNPALVEIRAERKQIASQIDAATNQVVESLRGRRLALEKGIADLERLVRDKHKRILELGDGRAQLARLEQAADAAQEIFLSYSVRAAELAARGHTSRTRVLVVSPPRAPERPEKRSALAYAAGGSFLAGLTTAMGIAGAGMRDRTVRDRADFRRATGIGCCVTLPYVSELRRGLDSVLGYIEGAQSSEYVEAVRGLRIRAFSLAKGARPLTILITSPQRHEGRSTLSLAMAGVSALDGVRVLLVECDTRSPVLEDMIGPSIAATNAVLNGTVPLEDAITRHTLGFDYLTMGNAGVPGHALLNIETLSAELRKEGGRWDLFILDSPPIMAVPDGLQLASKVQQCILVAEAAATEERMLAEAAARLSSIGVTRILGVLAALSPGRRWKPEREYTGY